jgi:hypothetical protein
VATQGRIANQVTATVGNDEDRDGDDSAVGVVPVAPPPVTNITNVTNVTNTTTNNYYTETTEILPAPAPTTPTTPIVDTVPPTTIVENWALINLIAALLTASLALVRLGLILARRRNDERDDRNELDQRNAAEDGSSVTAPIVAQETAQDNAADTATEDDEDRRKTSPFVIFLRILTGILAVGSLVLFVLTEDMSNPMVLVDGWTIWMLIILLVTIGVVLTEALLSRDEDEDENEDDYDYPQSQTTEPAAPSPYTTL